VDFLKPSENFAFYRAQKVAGDVAKSLDTPVVEGREAMDVRVIEQPTFRERLEAALKERPRAEVFDQILVPALSRAERDAARGELEESDLAFIRRVIGEILDDLEGTEAISLEPSARTGETGTEQADGKPASPSFNVAGVAASGTSDALTLRMLGQTLAPSNCKLLTIEGAGSPMQLVERVAPVSPAMVILSHLPPEALAQARYQVRRLRSRFSGLAIVVGRWGEAGSDAASQGLSGVGATHVAFTLADARDQILAKATSAIPYLEASGVTEGPLFRTAAGKTEKLTNNPMTAIDICRMMKRRLKAAGLPDQYSPHSFRVNVANRVM
jgi:hypothetical protein